MAAPFSRRDFIKASSAGLLGFLLADLRLDAARAATPKQGRSTFSGVELLTEPTRPSKRVYAFGQDEVMDISGEVDGELGHGNPFNSTWYRVNGDGYVYSGAIQPVDTVHHKPVLEIPESGVLGEITVPYSVTRRSSSVFADRGYRAYYSTTHWVTHCAVNRAEKGFWYQIYDRQSRETLYVPAHEMRIIPNEELTPLSPDVPQEQKHIYVSLKNQTVTAFEGKTPVLAVRCASGAKGTTTPLGEYRTYHKGPSIHMTNQGDGSENTYHLPGVPWVSFFTGTGVAFHGTYWHNDYGRPSSRGCINLSPNDAKFIYLWTLPEVPPDITYLNEPGAGTYVEVVLAD